MRDFFVQVFCEGFFFVVMAVQLFVWDFFVWDFLNLRLESAIER